MTAAYPLQWPEAADPRLAKLYRIKAELNTAADIDALNTVTADTLVHHDAIAAHSAEIAALRTHIEARSLALRIRGADAIMSQLDLAARHRDMTDAEDALWSHAETDRDEARKALHALVLRATGLTAETIGEIA